MTAPLLTVRWIDQRAARITLPNGDSFDAADHNGWSTEGNPATDSWTFTRFEDLLTFVQERTR
jgi:hypothetical protein